MRAIAVLGAGGHATSIIETARSAGYEVEFLIGPVEPGVSAPRAPVLAEFPDGFLESPRELAVAIGDNSRRQRTVEEIRKSYPHISFPSLVHESASVAASATMGEGAVVLQGAVVGANSVVGSFCIVNTLAGLDHDGILGDFASLGPGVITGGRVTIGPRSAISLGARVKHGVSVGSDTVVGAASYVHQDLPDNVVAYGCPATVIRPRASTDPYLT